MSTLLGLLLFLGSVIQCLKLGDSVPVLENLKQRQEQEKPETLLERTIQKIKENTEDNDENAKMGRLQESIQEQEQANNGGPSNSSLASDEDAMDIIVKENDHLNKTSSFWQGDIVLDSRLKQMLRYYKGEGPVARNAIFARYSVWITREIPYDIPPYMSHIKPNFYKAINEIHKYTCLRFVPYRGQKNRVRITNDAGCSSKIGRSFYDGYQTLSLAGLCNNPGTILHELVHALGFFHEQARTDRDKYVKVHWDNIQESQFPQFEKYPEGFIDLLGKSYDYKSIMHYGRTSFTKNGKPTIESLTNPKMKLGGQHLSSNDIAEINQLYDCQSTQYGWTRWSSYTPCNQETCYKIRHRYCYNGGNVKVCGKDTHDWGHEEQKAKCPPSICPKPVDGEWSVWTPWKPCSKTCGDGYTFRARTCNNPAPQNGGKACQGNSKGAKVCSLQRCHLDFDDTDFENNRLGMWSNAYDDKIDWEFLQYGSRTAGTGVDTGDHTITPEGHGYGFYLYIRSGFAQAGDKARLVSQWIQPENELRCLKFFYVMHGKGIGHLAVKVQEQGESIENTWFVKYGEQGEKWLPGILTLGFKKPFQIIFQGQVGTPWKSDITLDDIYIDPGPCNCQDEYYSCPDWKKSGECTTNKPWMQKRCSRSCGVCGCKDKNDKCPAWAKKGECEKNPTWMLRNCLLSCEVCDCFDDYDGCGGWVKSGLCAQDKWKQFMKDHCSKSCKFCTPS